MHFEKGPERKLISPGWERSRPGQRDLLGAGERWLSSGRWVVSSLSKGSRTHGFKTWSCQLLPCNLNMSLVLMSLSFLICPMGTRLVSPAEGSYEEVMRSGVLVKAALHHGGGVSRSRVRLSSCDLGSPSCPSWASVFLFFKTRKRGCIMPKFPSSYGSRPLLPLLPIPRLP